MKQPHLYTIVETEVSPEDARDGLGPWVIVDAAEDGGMVSVGEITLEDAIHGVKALCTFSEDWFAPGPLVIDPLHDPEYFQWIMAKPKWPSQGPPDGRPLDRLPLDRP